MKRVTLTDGTWVDLYDPGEVPQHARRAIRVLATALGPVLQAVTGDDPPELDLTEQQADQVLRLQQAVVAAAIAAWSRPEPAPTTVELVDELPGNLYDELTAATATVGADLAEVVT